MQSLRKARKGDEPQILKLVSSVLADYGLCTNTCSTDQDISDLNKYYFENNGWFAVIEDDNKIIGSYGIFRIDETTCELRKMYLFPEYQGKGFGKLMMDDAMAQAKNLGYTEMLLETNKVLDKAIGMYKKYGFADYDPGHLSDRCNHAMKKSL